MGRRKQLRREETRSNTRGGRKGRRICEKGLSKCQNEKKSRSQRVRKDLYESIKIDSWDTIDLEREVGTRKVI